MAEARHQSAQKRRGSLEQLCGAYVDSLRKAGKQSATEAELILRRHVLKPFPALAETHGTHIAYSAKEVELCESNGWTLRE
jgi:hypothetical protein